VLLVQEFTWLVLGLVTSLLLPGFSVMRW